LNKEYVLTKDDDAHWYIVLLDDLEQFNNCIESGYYEGIDLLDVKRIDGPEVIAFKEFRYV
jgi:hypothetical protein